MLIQDHHVAVAKVVLQLLQLMCQLLSLKDSKLQLQLLQQLLHVDAIVDAVVDAAVDVTADVVLPPQFKLVEKARLLLLPGKQKSQSNTPSKSLRKGRKRKRLPRRLFKQ